MFDAVIIAEKNSVARAFARNVSDGGKYSVERLNRLPLYVFKRRGETWASFGVSGHLMDYDFAEEYNSWRRVDPRVLFSIEPIKVVRGGNYRYVKALRQLAARSDYFILALDADPEGESIAFEVMNVIKRANPRARFRRAWFSALTKKDLEEALENLRSPDPNLASKSFARMQIDLTIGAAFTRALTRLVEKRNPRAFPRGMFLSYGPCQSPVLYLVVKRALEREKFKKQKFYVVVAELEADGARFKATWGSGLQASREDAEKVRRAVEAEAAGLVVKAVYRQASKKPPIPLNTVELERRASRFLNIRAKEALDTAENLYRDGLISYPRTETTIYPPTLDLRSIASMFTRHSLYGGYASTLLAAKPRLTPTAGKDDDKAHPPIYPTRAAPVEYVAKKFGRAGQAIYDLVVRHFLATLSDAAVLERQSITVKIAGYEFKAVGVKVVKEGYFEIYPFERPTERILPKLEKGSQVRLVKAEVVERETQPPPLLSESELLALMRRYGIGTDATMQEHIHTNIRRRYFTINRKRCIPTPLGRAVALALEEHVPEIVRPEVRGEIERELQRIASGEKPPEEVVKTVKVRFLEYYDRLMRYGDKVAESLLKAVKDTYGGEQRRWRR